MTEELEPIDGNAWAAYTAAGRDHFERVGRSWTVFNRNAADLLGVLDAIENDLVASQRLLNATVGNVGPDHDDERLRRAFWEAVDQHLQGTQSALARVSSRPVPGTADPSASMAGAS